MLSRRTVVLFTRAPEAEARAKGLPAAEGTSLFTGFLSGWKRRAAEADAELLIVTPVSTQAALKRLFPHETVAAQNGDTFGARVESAVALAFERGAASVVMVGGDGPPLDLEELRAGFAHLEQPGGALYLAPAEDGGVNAIGVNGRSKGACASVSWLRPTVAAQLTDAARRLELALYVGGMGCDLDSAADIARLYRQSKSVSIWNPFRTLLLAVLAHGRAICNRVRVAPASLARLVLQPRAPPVLPFA